MELVQVKILGQAITSRYGTLNAGDILRTDAEFAKHLVEDCGAAEYIEVPQAIAPEGDSHMQTSAQAFASTKAEPTQTTRKRGAK